MTTELNRRRVLMGLAAASGAAASASAGETSQSSESPELLELGNGLPQVEAKYWTASNKVRAIVQEVRQIWPDAPNEILTYAVDSMPETDITGAGIERRVGTRSDFLQAPRYGTPEGFEASIQRHQARIAHIMTTKSKGNLKYHEAALQKDKEALPMSRAYVAEIKRIRQSSGYDAASDAKEEARENLWQHVGAIMTAQPRGMEGVVIQAQALAAWQAIGFLQGMDPKAIKWPGRLAETILEQGTKA